MQGRLGVNATQRVRARRTQQEPEKDLSIRVPKGKKTWLGNIGRVAGPLENLQDKKKRTKLNEDPEGGRRIFDEAKSTQNKDRH